MLNKKKRAFYCAKSLHLLCVLILIVGLTGCGSTTSEEPRPVPKAEITTQSFTDTDLGINFDYPSNWGEPRVDTLVDHDANAASDSGLTGKITSINFLPETPEVAVPLVLLVSNDYQDEQSAIFTGFVDSAQADCQGLLSSNREIVATYQARNDADPEVVQLFAENPFACEAGELANNNALITYNPVQVLLPPPELDEDGQPVKQEAPDPEKIETNPIPAPTIEYRAPLEQSTAHQSIIISYLAFSDKPGTTYADYQGGTFIDSRRTAIEHFQKFINSIEIE